MTGLVATRRAVLGAAALSLLAPRTARAAGIALADPRANKAARDLASLLDGFSAAKTLAVGQQLNVNGDDPFGPLTALDVRADRVRVLGWTTNEWQYAVRHGYNQQVLGDLVERAQAGDVLVTSWYPRNPRTKAGAHDRPGPKVVRQVLTDGTRSAGVSSRSSTTRSRRTSCSSRRPGSPPCSGR